MGRNRTLKHCRLLKKTKGCSGLFPFFIFREISRLSNTLINALVLIIAMIVMPLVAPAIVDIMDGED